MYTSTPPLTCGAEGQDVDRLRGMAQEAHTWTQRGKQQFLDKLRKPGLELKTLDPDTMLRFMH